MTSSVPTPSGYLRCRYDEIAELLAACRRPGEFVLPDWTAGTAALVDGHLDPRLLPGLVAFATNHVQTRVLVADPDVLMSHVGATGVKGTGFLAGIDDDEVMFTSAPPEALMYALARVLELGPRPTTGRVDPVGRVSQPVMGSLLSADSAARREAWRTVCNSVAANGFAGLDPQSGFRAWTVAFSSPGMPQSNVTVLDDGETLLMISDPVLGNARAHIVAATDVWRELARLFYQHVDALSQRST